MTMPSFGHIAALCMGPWAACWGSACIGIAFPHLVILHHALQHWARVLKNVCHALEQGNADNAEEAQLQAQAGE